eukprot:snap_masked-scaffold_2-processed-gene-27.23-mRNA-1 protein AED:1.00 eAED:1.00 QI:0/-1/0/0/-1/1/1/0/305
MFFKSQLTTLFGMNLEFSFTKKNNKKKKLKKTSFSTLKNDQNTRNLNKAVEKIELVDINENFTKGPEVSKDASVKQVVMRKNESQEPILLRALKFKDHKLPEEENLSSKLYSKVPIEDFGARILSKFGYVAPKEGKSEPTQEEKKDRPESRSGLGFSHFHSRKLGKKNLKENFEVDLIRKQVMGKLVRIKKNKSDSLVNRVGVVQHVRQKGKTIFVTVAVELKQKEVKFGLKELPKIEVNLDAIKVFPESSSKFPELKKRYKKLIKQCKLELKQMNKIEVTKQLENELQTLVLGDQGVKNSQQKT